MATVRHVKANWPETIVPPGSPVTLFYEIDDEADAVTRNVEFYADGTVTRNSIEIEERTGKPCPSLIDCPIQRGFDGVGFDPVTIETFEEAWAQGVDTPFWNVV